MDNGYQISVTTTVTRALVKFKTTQRPILICACVIPNWLKRGQMPFQSFERAVYSSCALNTYCARSASSRRVVRHTFGYSYTHGQLNSCSLCGALSCPIHLNYIYGERSDFQSRYIIYLPCCNRVVHLNGVTPVSQLTYIRAANTHLAHLFEEICGTQEARIEYLLAGVSKIRNIYGNRV
jgi:hypothetical protein